MRTKRLSPQQMNSLKVSARVLEILAKNPQGVGTTEMAHKAQIGVSTSKSTLARLYSQRKCSRSRKKLKSASWCYYYYPIAGAMIDDLVFVGNGKAMQSFSFIGPPEDIERLEKPPLRMPWGNHTNEVVLGAYYPMWGAK